MTDIITLDFELDNRDPGFIAVPF